MQMVAGLDSTIGIYHLRFVEHKIDGRRLMILDHHDLERIGVAKVGHQEAILEYLELLLSFVRFPVATEQRQTYIMPL